MLGTSLRSVVRRTRTNPLRFALTLLQVMLGAFAVTVALSAYLSATAGRGTTDRFYLETGGYGPDTFRAQGLPEMLALAPDVAALATFDDGFNPPVEIGGARYRFRTAARVSPSYLELADIQVTRGSAFTSGDAEREARVLLLSEEAAQLTFGTEDPVGETVRVLGSLPFGLAASQPVTLYEVLGVYRRGSSPFGTPPDALFPAWVAEAPVSEPRERGSFSVPISRGAPTLLVQARPGRGEVAREQALAAARQVFPVVPGGEERSSFELEEVNEAAYDAGYADTSLLIFGLFALVATTVGAIGVFSTAVVETAARWGRAARASAWNSWPRPGCSPSSGARSGWRSQPSPCRLSPGAWARRSSRASRWPFSPSRPSPCSPSRSR